jgi:hypothetical protein
MIKCKYLYLLLLENIIMENTNEFIEFHKNEITNIVSDACNEYRNYSDNITLNDIDSSLHEIYVRSLTNKPYDYIKNILGLYNFGTIMYNGILYNNSSTIITLLLQIHIFEENKRFENTVSEILNRLFNSTD